MPIKKTSGLTKVALDELQPQQSISDPSLHGFGARRRAGPDVTFYVWYRNADGRGRRVTIGTYGKPWTIDQAKKRAMEVLTAAKVAGADPAAEKRARREAPTVAALCELYLADAEAGSILTRRGKPKKASTLATDRSRIAAHIVPLIGDVRVRALTRVDIERLRTSIIEGKAARRQPTGKKRGLSNVRGGNGAAARSLGLLGAILQFAVHQGMRADNPVRGVVRPADGQRDRRLSSDEYMALAGALTALSEPPKPKTDGRPGGAPMWSYAPAAMRFIALTGWRRGEVLNLRWREVDLVRRTARLGDTKTGESIRPLSHRACRLLRGLDRIEGTDLVFPGSRGTNQIMSGFQSMVDRMIRRANLPPDVTAHVLRHSFASIAADLGFSEITIGALIGHRGGTITRRYTHHADAVLLAAADKVADEIAVQMGEAPAEAVVVPLEARAGAAA